MKTTNRIADKARSHLSTSDSKPKAHVAEFKTGMAIRMVNGRLISKTLADPELKDAVKQATKTMFPNRAAFVKEMHRRGVLSSTGKLTKNYGGSAR